MKSGSERFIAVIPASFLEGERCYSSHYRKKTFCDNQDIVLRINQSTFLDHLLALNFALL